MKLAHYHGTQGDTVKSRGNRSRAGLDFPNPAVRLYPPRTAGRRRRLLPMARRADNINLFQGLELCP